MNMKYGEKLQLMVLLMVVVAILPLIIGLEEELPQVRPIVFPDEFPRALSAHYPLLTGRYTKDQIQAGLIR